MMKLCGWLWRNPGHMESLPSLGADAGSKWIYSLNSSSKLVAVPEYTALGMWRNPENLHSHLLTSCVTQVRSLGSSIFHMLSGWNNSTSTTMCERNRMHTELQAVSLHGASTPFLCPRLKRRKRSNPREPKKKLPLLSQPPSQFLQPEVVLVLLMNTVRHRDNHYLQQRCQLLLLRRRPVLHLLKHRMHLVKRRRPQAQPLHLDQLSKHHHLAQHLLQAVPVLQLKMFQNQKLLQLLKLRRNSTGQIAWSLQQIFYRGTQRAGKPP